MRIAIVGAGGIGGYFGARFAAAGNDVVFLARGRQLAALRSDGLTLKSILGDLHLTVTATDDPASVGPCELVLFCVKGYHTTEALPLLEPLVGAGTSVASLQNTIDRDERIADTIGRENVLGAAAYIFSNVRAPGVIEHSAGPAVIEIGELDGGSSERVDRIVRTADAAGISMKAEPDIRARQWGKFAFICAVAGMTSAVRLTIGEIRTVPESREALRRIASEVVTVARAEGVALPADAADSVLAGVDAQLPGMYSSMYEDLVAGRRMELDDLHGEVLRRADRHGIAAPTTAAVLAVLRPWAVRAAQA
jgi:2-dehydropantoate 2-reductase